MLRSNLKFLFLLTLALISCHDNVIVVDKSSLNSYPVIISHLHLQKIYDDAKWRLYCLYCYDTVKFKNNIIEGGTVTYGELNCNLSFLFNRHDTAELYFGFNNADSQNLILDNMQMMAGAAYRYGPDSFVSYIDKYESSYRWWKCINPPCPPNKYIDYLQPEVITYIKNNKHKINKWFFNEAKKRGVL
jgi:hypothetical protein